MVDLTSRRLYLCTPMRDDLERFLDEVIAGGVDVVQLRDKEHDARELVDAATRAQAICRERGVPFVMNDRPDLALEVGADGVHVGQDDASVALCRRILGPDAIVGLSTHARDELGPALDEAVTYISAGPVVSTPTKPGRPGTGIGYAQEAIARSQVPVFVTGGVSPESVPGLVEAGVEHFVVVRHLVGAADPGAAARRLRRAIDEALAAKHG